MIILLIHLISVEGNSGIGDGGLMAIKRFKEQHICNNLCKTLELASIDEWASDVDQNGCSSDEAETSIAGDDPGLQDSMSILITCIFRISHSQYHHRLAHLAIKYRYASCDFE